MKIHFYIIQEEIDKGIPCQPSFCPIALSGKKIIHGFTVGVYRMFMSATDAVGVPLPKEAFAWARKFDNREPVEPFDFVVEF